jgi:hypothetical protein
MNGKSSQRMGSGGGENPRTVILPANRRRALRAIRSLTKIAARPHHHRLTADDPCEPRHDQKR